MNGAQREGRALGEGREMTRGERIEERREGGGGGGGLGRGTVRGKRKRPLLLLQPPLQPLSPKDFFFVIKLFVTARRITRIAHIGFHASPRRSVIPSHLRASSPLALLRAKKPTKRDCSVLTSRNALCERIHFVQR